MPKLIKILITTLFLTTSAYSQSGNENLQDIHNLKALFIYNFTKYIEWPPMKSGAPFVIAVYGKSPVKEKLEILLKGRKIHNRPVEIRYYNHTDTAAQIIYIPSEWSGKVPFIGEANFKMPQSTITYNTKALNARLLATGKSTGDNSPFIPVHFELDSKPGILPGTFAEVYLKTTPLHNTLIIPVTALVEEQGVFYVYVQTEGESFQKREVKLGANDGQQAQVLSGVAEGERVVTKGAYQIKLSTASGTLPAHGHEH